MNKKIIFIPVILVVVVVVGVGGYFAYKSSNESTPVSIKKNVEIKKSDKSDKDSDVIETDYTEHGVPLPTNVDACKNVYSAVQPDEYILDSVYAHIGQSFVENCEESADVLSCTFKKCYESSEGEEVRVPDFFELDDMGEVLANVIYSGVTPLFELEMYEGVKQRFIEPVQLPWFDSNLNIFSEHKKDIDKHLVAVFEMMIMKFLKAYKDENVDERVSNLMKLFSQEAMSVSYNDPKDLGGVEDYHFKLDDPKDGEFVTNDFYVNNETAVDGIVLECMKFIKKKQDLKFDLVFLTSKKLNMDRAMSVYKDYDKEVLKDFLIVLYLHKHAVTMTFRDELLALLKAGGVMLIYMCGDLCVCVCVCVFDMWGEVYIQDL
eukprot:GHVR01076359.1.p1 GENE.GHVR01076359.1~~GHVR01076359.1.p1  ORF type:complete len:376 (-),score=91.25 GHVR01076359.1:115-1242(-)